MTRAKIRLASDDPFDRVFEYNYQHNKIQSCLEMQVISISAGKDKAAYQGAKHIQQNLVK